MKCQDAYNKGYDCGFQAAIYTDYDSEMDESLESAAYDSELNARDFSPWEFIAHEINDNTEERSEQLWEWYDKGVTAGIKAGIRVR